MGLADELESNLDELYEATVASNAHDSFNVAIAATIRRVIDATAPVLAVRVSTDEPLAGEPAAAPSVRPTTVQERPTSERAEASVETAGA